MDLCVYRKSAPGHISQNAYTNAGFPIFCRTPWSLNLNKYNKFWIILFSELPRSQISQNTYTSLMISCFVAKSPEDKSQWIHLEINVFHIVSRSPRMPTMFYIRNRSIFETYRWFRVDVASASVTKCCFYNKFDAGWVQEMDSLHIGPHIANSLHIGACT